MVTVERLGGISIHALHEESDRTDEATWKTHVISIHALHEESDINFQV